MYHQVAILVYLIYFIYQDNYYVSPDSYSCLPHLPQLPNQLLCFTSPVLCFTQ